MHRTVPTRPEVFVAEFVKVASLSELEPNQLRGSKVNDKYVAVVKIGDDLFAFEDTCTHAACSISPGEVEDYLAPCYCHGALFDVRTGAAVQGPAARPLRMFAVKVENGDVYVEL
jgi:3-phenylpropionate/trans-cinnamate dioxygenase ferredoxin subunit